jgi:hypothetical protein
MSFTLNWAYEFLSVNILGTLMVEGNGFNINQITPCSNPTSQFLSKISLDTCKARRKSQLEILRFVINSGNFINCSMSCNS